MSIQIENTVDSQRLFVIGKLSIFMVGLGFAVRAYIAPEIQSEIFDPLDLANSASMIGEILAASFVGFAVSLLFGSMIVDHIGIKKVLLLSALGYTLGSFLIIFTSYAELNEFTYWFIYIGFLLTGIGWGAVEAASNPLVVALFPEDRTHRLNILHAWWPGGIVVGGVVGVGLSSFGLPWQGLLLLLILPSVLLAVWAARATFPVTERVKAGISHGEMYGELLRSPGFLFWFFCMFLTAATELAPGQWVDLALSRVVGMQGILLLVYVSALMFVMRHFAGPLAHRLSPVGLLWAGSVFAAIGLYALSLARSPASAFVAATIWGVGVCYMWPTMLATASERYPKGGAFFMGLMGFAGGMSIQLVLPYLGGVFDRAKIEAAGGFEKFKLLQGEDLQSILQVASIESFQVVAIIPVFLVFVFGLFWLYERKRKDAVTVKRQS